VKNFDRCIGYEPLLVQEIFKTLRDLNELGLTILLVEQNVRQALRIAHYAYVMENGEIVLSGPSAELLNNPKVIEAYLGAWRALEPCQKFEATCGCIRCVFNRAVIRPQIDGCRLLRSKDLQNCFSLYQFSFFLHLSVGLSCECLSEIPISVAFWLVPTGFRQWHETCLSRAKELAIFRRMTHG
jgi:hypothetical protein